MKQLLLLLTLITAVDTWSTLQAQPRYDRTRLNLEHLNRGVVAFRNGTQVIVSWRTLSTDAIGQPFDVFRNGQKLNAAPLKKGGTFFIDAQPLKGDATYEIRGGNHDGSFTLKADAPDGYLALKLQKPAAGTTPDGETYTYHANDASVADVDGDGQYEIILKWDPSNAHDNAHDGYTGPTLFDCYRLDGTRLWHINLGINIRSGAHYVPFIVYDLDGDGRAELIVRTSDGTHDALGHVIGDSLADYRHRPQPADSALPGRPPFAEVTVYGRDSTVSVTLPPPWNEVKGMAIDGGMVFRLPAKTRGEVDAIRRLLDAEPTLREKRGKPLTYDLVAFYDLVSGDLDDVKKTIGMFAAEHFLVRIEGESNGVLRVSTISPRGFRQRLKQMYDLTNGENGQLVLTPKASVPPPAAREPAPPATNAPPPVARDPAPSATNAPPPVAQEAPDPPATTVVQQGRATGRGNDF